MNWLKSLIRKGRSWLQLDWESRWFLLQALVLLPIVSLSLHLWGLRRTQAALGKLCKPKLMSGEVKPLHALKTVRIVEIASRYTRPWSTCLRRSLVLWYLLRRQGIMSELRIGVQRTTGEILAHAWVEYLGSVLNDQQDVRQRYAMFEQPIDLTGYQRGK